MKFPRRTLVAAALGLATALGGARAHADTFAAGSWIVPMDTTYQDAGMLRAYGLVYALLRAGVPVRWVIQPSKLVGDADFVASAKDHKSGAIVSAHGYRGGPFVVDAADAAKALPIIDAWQTANAAVAVHEATDAFAGEVARVLVAAPKIAMHADGNQNIAVGYLNAAGIPDSTGAAWPASSPDLLTPAEVAGPTTTNHHDGALFDSDGAPIYCQFMSMHWGVTEAQKAPEVVAEVRDFLASPTHFFAECQAVDVFENLMPQGLYLTTGGFAVKSQPSSVDWYNADQTFAQIDGDFATVGGSEPAYMLPAGTSYKTASVTMATAHGAAPGTWDVWMTGYLDGACPPRTASCGALGKVSYLGGHQYTTTLPISTHPTTQGVRLFLNSLFDSTCASAKGLPVVTLTKSAPPLTTDGEVTYQLDFANAGPTVALSATISDPLPADATFVSASNGGALSGSTITWSLGNLGVHESGSVSLTVRFATPGAHSNVAKLAYQVGLNPFSVDSNAADTLFDPTGGGGDGGLDGATDAGDPDGSVGDSGSVGDAGDAGADASGGDANASDAGGDATPASPTYDGGCGCATPGRARFDRALVALGALAGLGVLARRRQRR